MKISTKIKLSELINYPFEEINFDGAYEFEYILSKLNIISYEVDNEKLDKTLFKIKNIYDNPHYSDENSYRYLLYFKDRFCCLYGYTGDRGTSTVEFASNEIAIELRNYFLSLIETEYSIIDEEFVLSDNYTNFFELGGKYYYHINNPRCSYCFHEEDDNLFYNKEDNLEPCKFLRYKTKKQYWEARGLEDKIIIVRLNDGTEVEAQYNELLFLVKTK